MGSLETDTVALNRGTFAPQEVAPSEPNSQTPMLKPSHTFSLTAQNHQNVLLKR